MKRKPKFVLPTKYILLILSGVCIVAILLSFTLGISGGPLNTVAGYVFIPMQRGINSVGSWIGEKADNLKKLNDVMAENEDLKRQVDDLTTELNTIKLEQLHDGLKAIQAHHENMVFAVEVGEIRILEENGNTIYGVTGTGFAQIINNRATVIVDTCESPEEIDVRRAQEAKERAEEQLRQKQSIEEYHRSKASLARAMARLKVGSKDQPIGY